MTKHTPGPWMVGNRFYVYAPGDPFSLAEVKCCNTVPALDVETHEANARLISASPDLLAACIEVANAMDILGAANYSDETRAARQQVAAAIAKANGETP